MTTLNIFEKIELDKTYNYRSKYNRSLRLVLLRIVKTELMEILAEIWKKSRTFEIIKIKVTSLAIYLTTRQTISLFINRRVSG